MPYNNAGRRQIVVLEAPAHPVAQLQEPFEESMFESQSATADEPDVPLDAGTRRNMLLEAPVYQRVIAGRWRQRPGERYHPLWKLVAQMSFGIHLLSENMAKSEEDVFQILQTHVDDIDIFLERTTEDFTLAQDDIQERLKCLRLPLQHADVFERMLEDRIFRNSIVEGNEKIEHIVHRTGAAMKDALKDVQKGFDSSNMLEKYLVGLETTWVRRTTEHEAVFVAMLGNVEGWKRAFRDLHMQGNKLNGSLRKLTEIVNQMQQKAGEVSRRLVQPQRRAGSITSSNSITYHARSGSATRSSSRQHQNTTSESPKKNLPNLSAVPGRNHSRSQSREAPRIDSAQGERSGTGLSMRSGELRSGTPSSRSASRTENPGQDPSRMKIGTPRIIYVNTGHHRANSLSASVRGSQLANSELRIDSALSNRSESSQHSVRTETPQNQVRRQESNISTMEPSTPVLIEPKSFAPVELPADIPPEAFLQAPMSNKNRLSAGLGFLPSERRAHAATASNVFNPATALVELLRDQSRLSKLPLTPNSSTSATVPTQALSALEGKQHLTIQPQQAAKREPTPEQTPPVGKEDTSDETPDTPAWAVQVLDDEERKRVLAEEKIPFSTKSPNVNNVTANTEKGEASQKQDTSKPMSTSATAPSELSAGYEDDMPTLNRQPVTDNAVTIDKVAKANKTKKKLSFIPELEGSEPVFLPSTVYTPTSAVTVESTAYELEAPDSYFTLPVQSNATDSKPSHVSELSSGKDEASGLADEEPTGATTPRNDKEQAVLEQAIRKSITDADIPLPAPPPVPDTISVKEPVELSSQLTPKPKQVKTMSPEELAKKPSEEDKMAVVATSEKPMTEDQQLSAESSKVDEKRVTTIHTPASSKTSTPTVLPKAEKIADVDAEKDEDEDIKSRPVTTIHSPPDVEKLSIVLPTSVSKLATVDASTTDVTTTPKISEKRQSSTTLSNGDTQSTTVPEPPNEQQQSPRTVPLPMFPTNVDVTTASSAPNTGTKTSPKSSTDATSPASLVSVNSAPAADLKRANTKETRKQWRAFFSGQLKSPKSPSASSVKSTRSNKSRNTSISSSHKHSTSISSQPNTHKHTNSVSSQTNASVKTLWLTSPTVPDQPGEESSSSKDNPNVVADNVKQQDTVVSKPSVSLSQPPNSTSGSQKSVVGLGLITSPESQPTTSALHSPLSPTPTVSTAVQKYAILGGNNVSDKSTAPAKLSTLISFPKPRMIEVRRKAVGSGISLINPSQPANDKTTTSDIAKDIDSIKHSSATEPEIARSLSPEMVGIKLDEKSLSIVEDQRTPKANSGLFSRGTTPIPNDQDTTLSIPEPKKDKGDQENIAAVLPDTSDEAQEAKQTTEQVEEKNQHHNEEEEPQQEEYDFTKGHERGLSNVTSTSKDINDFLDAYA